MELCNHCYVLSHDYVIPTTRTRYCMHTLVASTETRYRCRLCVALRRPYSDPELGNTRFVWGDARSWAWESGLVSEGAPSRRARGL